MNLIEDLQWRGLLADCTDIEALGARLAQGPISLYCGFDPTGDSLHVGHLMGQLTLRRFQLAGHHPIALAGGATGMVGDPSGKSAERNLLTREQLEHNVKSITAQLSRLLDFECANNPARLVNNADWTAPISLLDFLRDIGKHFPLSSMLAKDSVKSRMGSEAGISFTEFSYQLLQAFDFCHLRNTLNCELQIGGSDQWGNITAGIELTRRKLGETVWGWTFPLITKADGSKFGKTESGAVWLDPARTSPYRFYQFFLNTEDAKVGEYLRKFTFLNRERIEALDAALIANPGAREAQKALAEEVTRIVHGEDALQGALKASAILFGAPLDDVSETVFADVVSELPIFAIAGDAKAALLGEGLPLVDALAGAALCASKGQARKDIDGGGVYVNNQRVSDNAQKLNRESLLFGRYVLLRKGKKSYAVAQLAD